MSPNVKCLTNFFGVQNNKGPDNSSGPLALQQSLNFQRSFPSPNFSQAGEVTDTMYSWKPESLVSFPENFLAWASGYDWLEKITG